MTKPDEEITLDGASVVARCEAMLGSVPADDPAAALGIALTGIRATCTISGADGEASVAAIRAAAGRQAPFVAHLHARAAASHEIAQSTGHDALHTLADAGALVLVAQTVQDAAYLTVVARAVAERALVPAVVALDEEEISRTGQPVALPSPDLVEEMAGRASDIVPCATHAQQFLFGEVRRRIPKWIDRENPALLGPVAGPEAWALGAAGRRPWVLARVQLLLQEEFDRLADRTGRRFESAPAFGLDRADVVVVAIGSLAETAKRVAEQIRQTDRTRIGVLAVRTLRPFPATVVAEILKGKKRILVLERGDAPLAGDPPLTREIRAALTRATTGRPARPARIVTAIAGAGGLPVADDDLRSLCLASIEEADRVVYLGVDFLPDDPDHPKRQAFHDRLGRQYPDIRSLGHRAERTSLPASTDEPSVPPAVRRADRGGADWSSLPRFWDQVGILYHEERTEQLSPDPHFTLGAVPPLSAGFRDRSARSSGWPALDPELCTGCGLCWTLCPDGAIAAAALGVRELLDAGLDAARERGKSPDVLRSVLAPLASKAEARIRTEAPARFGDAVRPALEEALAKSKPPPDRRDALASALDAVLDEVGELPVSRTSLFDDAAKGKGILFSLGVDPTSCQSCGVCIAACEPGALTDDEASDDRRRIDVSIHRRLADLPGPSAATLDRVRVSEAGPAAALLLGPENRSAMCGGDRAEPASGARLALRLVQAAAVSHLAPRLGAFVGELDQLRAKFAAEIRSGMLDAVPTNDLDAISSGLRVLGGPDVDVGDLIKRLEDACDSDRIDAERLSTLVDAAKDVANLRDAAARTGSPTVPPPLVLAGDGLGWAATFPDNPFAGPVVVDAGRSAARVALGLSEGVSRDVAHGAGLVRRARATLDQPLAPASAESPSWSELADAERAWAPPVTLVVDAVTWGRQELGAVQALLGSRRPVVVVVLSEKPERPSPALHALARRDVFTLQSSVAFPDHLAVGLADAFASGRPAFLHVLAPSPSAAGVASEQLIERARQPVEARAFPLFRYRPDADAGDRLSLDGNPSAPTVDARAEDLAAWETLTELAGIAGPGVDHAREEGRTAERDAARREWEPKVDAADREAREDMERRLTNQLMALSGWGDESG